MGCKEGCSEEFKRSNFLLSDVKAKLFITSEWDTLCRGCRVFYPVWRVLWALLFLAVIIISGVVDYPWYNSDDDRVKWFIYVTNWSIFTVTCDVIIQAATTLYGYHRYRHTNNYDLAIPEMTWYLKLQWVVSNAAMSSAIFITLAFWGVIYSPEYTVHWPDMLTHGVNTGYYVINLFITAQPLRIYHAWHVIIFLFIYTLFTVIYDFAGGFNSLGNPYIYDILDWSASPGWSAIYFVIFIFAGIVLWLFLYALYRVRLAVACALRRKSVDQDPIMTSSQEMKGSHVTVVSVY